MFDRLANALEGNPALARRNRFAPLTIAIQSDDDHWTLHLGKNPIEVVKSAPASPDVTLAASSETWNAFAQTIPPVGYQAINGMMRMGHMTVRGDMLAYGRHLGLIEQVFASIRPPAPAHGAPHAIGKPWIESVVGRYLHTELNNRPHRIYFEGAVSPDDFPLLCLHTAGADGRQYRAILNDPEVTRHFRVIAFDLPWHGKSSPPPAFETEVYRLTTKLYVDTVMAVSRALQLDKPVVMGCSIGGRAVLHLALQHGAYFRAAVGLQSALYAEPGANPALRDLELVHRPDVHGGEAASAFVSCLISPTAPATDRWETLWHYAQGGPGIFMGDLVYYSADGDMRNVDLTPLRNSPCPLYLLTGEYDLSATPELTADLAAKVSARHFEVMAGLGHFPMSESPDQFLGYLRPVLDAIREDT